jgi:hypothetical protein
VSHLQQHVVDQTTAEGCFPQTAECICNGDSPPDPDCPGVGPHPPSVTYLPGPIVCETCEGSRQHFLDLQTQIPGPCPDCEGRGYPTRLEIVSVDRFWASVPGDAITETIVHGVVKLGPPIPVVDYADWEVDGDTLAGVVPFVMVNDHPDMDKPHVILVTQTIEDGGLGFDLDVTVKPGDVVYPITVKEQS